MTTKLPAVSDISRCIKISTATKYLPEQSDMAAKQYVFCYTITIENNSERPVQLLNRRWLITDAENKVSEVEGEGVIGQQPVISPNSSYTYTSGSVFNTPVGTMQGYYELVDNESEHFWVEIPVFTLAIPHIVN